jgi:SAM-dependent methyltransferase
MVSISLASRTCPICGSRDNSRVFAGANVDLQGLDAFAFAARKLPEYMHWRLVECGRCDLLYVDPAPPLDELAALYRDADFNSREEAGLASRTYSRFLPGIVNRLPDRDGAADVGTGDGAFLQELLAAGFRNVAGIEPSSAPIEAADPAVRPLIRHDIFRPDSFPAGSLSLITCFQTIEHLADPLAFCRHARRALKPGGALLLIGHNRRAFSAKVLGRKSPIFDIEHMQLFSPKSARNLLDAAGFPDVEARIVYNRYPARYWAQLFPFPKPIKTRLLNLLKTTPLGRPIIPLPAGNMALIAYKSAGKGRLLGIKPVRQSSRIGLLPTPAEGGDGHGERRIGVESKDGRLAGMANGGRITAAEIRADRGQARTGMQPGQVHGQVARLDDRGSAAGPAQHGEPDAEAVGHGSRNRVDGHDRLGQQGFLGQNGGNRARIE